MNYKLINRDSNFTKGWELYKDGTLIASTFKTDLPSITFSDEVAKELGIIDVEKLVDKLFKEEFRIAQESMPAIWYDIKLKATKLYNQALSDNKDKLFTLEDMKECFRGARRLLPSNNESIDFQNWYKIFQSLTKQEFNCSFVEKDNKTIFVNKIW